MRLASTPHANAPAMIRDVLVIALVLLTNVPVIAIQSKQLFSVSTTVQFHGGVSPRFNNCIMSSQYATRRRLCLRSGNRRVRLNCCNTSRTCGDTWMVPLAATLSIRAATLQLSPTHVVPLRRRPPLPRQGAHRRAAAPPARHSTSCTMHRKRANCALLDHSTEHR